MSWGMADNELKTFLVVPLLAIFENIIINSYYKLMYRFKTGPTKPMYGFNSSAIGPTDLYHFLI
jgi:hypothetical protein